MIIEPHPLDRRLAAQLLLELVGAPRGGPFWREDFSPAGRLLLGRIGIAGGSADGIVQYSGVRLDNWHAFRFPT